MTRSVKEIRQESERDRMELANTVGLLKTKIRQSSDDVRESVSPAHIKSELGGYLTEKGSGWLGSLKAGAAKNPMQAVAAGAVIAVPLLRALRGIPLPLLMIGAGLAIGSKAGQRKVAETTTAFSNAAQDLVAHATERAEASTGGIQQTASSAVDQISDKIDRLKGVASDPIANFRQATVDAQGRAAETLSATDGTTEALDQATNTVRNVSKAAPEAARNLIRENAAIIGALGVAIGAVIAASLPTTRPESATFGRASSRIRETAEDAIQSGLEKSKNAAFSAADAATRSVADADLGAHASQLTGELADHLKSVAEDVVTTAFEPNSEPHVPEE